MIRAKHVAAALVALAALGGCGNNGEEADPPAGGINAIAGAGIVTVTWNDDVSVTYWLFVSTDPTMTVDNFATRTDIRVLRDVRALGQRVPQHPDALGGRQVREAASVAC